MIRPLQRADIPAAMELKRAAGWNQTEADWENVLALEPEGCFVWDEGGRAVGSTTVVRFGDVLAWIGMVLVHPDFRRRGIARALMEHALLRCDRWRVGCVKLDATDMGRPLYAALGFVEEQPIERWVRDGAAPANGAQAEPARAAAIPPGLLALDAAAFGADRSELLRRLSLRWPDQLRLVPGGYALARPGSDACFVGPCVAADASAARRAISGLLAQRPGERHFWDVLPRHAEAVRLAEDLGFRPTRRLVRMSRPLAAEIGDPSRVWATAGFEYG